MTAAGWTLMLVSCCCVAALAAYCYYKVLTTPSAIEPTQGPLEIDTHDRDT